MSRETTQPLPLVAVGPSAVAPGAPLAPASAESADAPRREPAAWVAPAVAAAAVVVAVVIRLGFYQHRVLPIAFGIPLVLFGWLQSRRWLWVTTGAFVAITIVKFLILGDLHANEGGANVLSAGERAWDTVLILTDLVVISAVVHALIGARRWLERRNADLVAANRDLADREEELARANEELQNQAEELERSGEELRVANDDLAERERTLNALLTLSRVLATDLSRDQMLERICETMGHLIDSGAMASAILERRPAAGGAEGAAGAERSGGAGGAAGDHLAVTCHHGFVGGLREAHVPVDQSFAAVVLSKGRTGYIEDLALRPDLVVPQPRVGPPHVSVLACPLRVAGRPVGTLEVYSRDRGGWADRQVALLESLAAQTSVSLEAAHLFEDVQQERRRLEAVLRAVPIGIAVSNADGSDVRLNPAGAALFNLPTDANFAEATIGGAIQRYVDGRAVGRDEFPLARAARDGVETHGAELEVHTPAGRRLVLLIDAAPIRDAQRRVAGAVSAFVDITAQKELQRELDLRRREAEEASVRKTRFLAAVSHDIRTPANAISLLAELIRRAAASPAMAAEVPELAQELHGSAMSLVNLLSDVLDLARYDSGRVELQESEFPLAAFLEDESRQMQPLARQKGLDLQYVPPADPVWLRADRIKLSRVLGNLVGNAIKFTDRGSVRVESVPAAPGGGVAIRVTDTGVGIPPEHQHHIFDEFIQLRNPERDRTKGTGLGLTICKRLVDAMGGRLEVRSAPGEGSTFTVTLPASAFARAPT